MAYCIDSRPANGLPGEVHDTKLNDLGAVREFSDGFYIYLQGVASTASGDWVMYRSGSFTTSRLTTGMRGSVAVATAAVVASKYGWYGVKGAFSANCLSASLSNGYLYATATAGSAEDLLVKNEQIQRATATGAPVTTTGGGAQTCVIDFPVIGANDESA